MWRSFRLPGQLPGSHRARLGPLVSGSPAPPAGPHPGSSASAAISPPPRPLLRQRPIKLIKRHIPERRNHISVPRGPFALLHLPPIPLWCSSPPLSSPSPAQPGPVTHPLVSQILGYREVGQPRAGPQDGGPIRGQPDFETPGWRGGKEPFCTDLVI